jgi:hypothetical protein
MVLIAAVLVTLGAAPPELVSAEAAMAKYKYAEAVTALKKARSVKGLDRPSLLRILELQGIAAGQQRQSAQAVAAFTQLLTLDPTHKLDGDFAPRVTTPFQEAGQAVNEAGALELKALEPGVSGRRVTALSVAVPKDALKLARSIIFHFDAGAGLKAVPAPLAEGRATISIDAADARWWAEVTGENDAQLVLVGSDAAPLTAAPPAPVAVDTPPPPPPIVEVPAVSKPAAGSPLRTVSFVVGGLAVAAAGTGAFFGLRSSSALQSISSAQRNGAGQIIGLTEREAVMRGAQAATDGVIANALFIGAGVLAATGVVLFFIGGDGASSVALTPAPGGLVVSGSFR